MSTSNCGEFCTAAKCQELEAKISQLEQALVSLEAQFNSHRQEDIPFAHDYIPDPNEPEPTPDPQVVVGVFDQGNNTFGISVQVGTEQGQDSFSIDIPEPEPDPQVAVEVFETGNNTFGISVQVGTEQGQDSFSIDIPEPEPEPKEIELTEPIFDINVSYLSDILTMAVTIDSVTKSDSVYIDAEIINNFNSGGNGGNSNNNDSNDNYYDGTSNAQIGGGDNDMGCEGLADTVQLNLSEILAAIAAVQAQVTEVKKVITIEVEGEALTKFDCPEDKSEDGKDANVAKVENYRLETLPAIHEMLRYLNENQRSMFEKICTTDGVIAQPAWWQTRLNAAVPQIACVFRKGGSSTYHSISIPHPADPQKPDEPLLPAYKKGNYQGMVVCRDNSKFIINCDSEAEAERMCSLAIGLINGNWLESPPRVHIGKRKGQAVGVDPMILTSMEYFESGQKFTVPNWRVRVSELE